MVGSANQIGFKRKDKGKAARQGGPSTSAPKVNKSANQHKRGKRSAKKNISKVKCYNCNKLGHFAHTGATRHVARDRAGFVDYRKIPAGTHVVYMGNGSYEEALGVVHLHGMPRLGHIGKDRMTRLAREGLLGPLAKVDLPICEPCLAGKAYNLTISNTPQQNGVAERRNRTLLDMVRSMMAQANLPISFWGDALLTATYILNRVPSQSVSSTPYESLERRKAQFRSIYALGDLLVLYTAPPISMENWDPRARKHIFIRYSDSSKGYVMYGEHPNGGMTEIESRDIDFIETDFPSIGNANRDLDLYELEEDEGTLPSSREGGGLVPHPVKRKVDGSIDRYKARLVAKGYTQQEGINYEEYILPSAGNDMDSIVTTKKWLSSSFEMKDMGEANFVLGVKITRDRSKKLLSLSQGTYIKKILERFHMHNSKPIDTPMEKGCTLSLDQCPKNDEEKNQMSKVPYASAIGSLMYTMLCTRPDASDKDDRKSISGHAFILGGGVVSWCSKKHSCIALSTMESEYVACLAIVQEAVWLRRFLQHLGVTAHAEDVILLYSDSTLALVYAKDPKYHGKAKHIELRYHYIRDMVSQGEVILQHISTSSMMD
uniref:Integrase catalytic domain-containing protein n=1 Tax=Fagus sylvatica TaxID=28930 RepID=A0A2N9HFT4_FAGSY